MAPGCVVAGKYTLVRPLGVGGMGAVWAACNESTGAEVAVKMLLPRPDDSAEIVARFRREAYATAQLSHRGIVRIYDLVEHDGDTLVLVMERLRGRSLAMHLAQFAALPLEEAIGIALDVLSALAHAHGAGVVHRDLKPENIFLAVDPDGLVTPKILDFGISKLRFPEVSQITREGEMLGTPSYMSPEQVRGGEIDARSDLFNVGILLYEMISGHNPFAGTGMHSIVVAVLEETPPPLPGVSPELAAVVARALSKTPADRFASAAELALALRAAMGMPARPTWSGLREPTESLPPPPVVPPATVPRPMRRPFGVGAAAVAFATLALVVLFFGPARLDARPRLESAIAQHERAPLPPIAKSSRVRKAVATKRVDVARKEELVSPPPARLEPPAALAHPSAFPLRRATALNRRGAVARDPGF
jgi:serine/threonine-protein kinase